MTQQDFKSKIDSIFERSPLVPAVLELVSGVRVIVDMPEQLDIQLEVVIIRRRTDPAAQTIRYEDINCIAALDQLPAEGDSLSYSEFYGAIRPLLRQEPYRPFAIDFRDGSRLLIDSPGRLSLAGRFCVFLPPGPFQLIRFTYDQVARVTPLDLVQAG
jgi:hypothetical protein